MNAAAREQVARAGRIEPLNLAVTQAVRELADAWHALDEHDRTAPAVSSVTAAQVRREVRVQLRQRLTSARSGLDCLLREDV